MTAPCPSQVRVRAREPAAHPAAAVRLLLPVRHAVVHLVAVRGGRGRTGQGGQDGQDGHQKGWWRRSGGRRSSSRRGCMQVACCTPIAIATERLPVCVRLQAGAERGTICKSTISSLLASRKPTQRRSDRQLVVAILANATFGKWCRSIIGTLAHASTGGIVVCGRPTRARRHD